MVAIHPPLIGFLQQDVADRLARESLFGDEPESLATAWQNVGGLWDATIERARPLPPADLDEQVDGEWSFLETLRHLVFVTDVWVRDVIQEWPAPHHAWGMPPHFVADAAAGLGLDIDARPSLDDVLAVKRERDEQTRRVIAGLTKEELMRTCAPRGGQFLVVGAVQAVVYETWAHLQYATRDLDLLRRRGSSTS